MISGLLVLSLPMSVIGANFGNEMERVEKEEREKALEEEGALLENNGLQSVPSDPSKTLDLLRARLAAQIQAAVLESLESAGASVLPVWAPPGEAVKHLPSGAAVFAPEVKAKAP